MNKCKFFKIATFPLTIVHLKLDIPRVGNNINVTKCRLSISMKTKAQCRACMCIIKNRKWVRVRFSFVNQL